MIKRFPLPAGIIHESTQFAASGSWYDCNNVRFRTGRAESIGGWVRDGMYELDGTGRASFTSRDFSGNNYQFVGTNRKFYIINGTRATDITPVGSTEVVTGSNLFTPLGGGTALVRINDISHGMSVNDWVVFSGISGGSAPSEYPSSLMEQYEGFQIFSIDDADNFTIYVVSADTGLPVTSASTTAWVTDYTIYRKVSSGLSSQVEGQGWGAGAWGGDDFTPDLFDLNATPVGSTDGSAVLTFADTATPVSVGEYVYFMGLSGTIGTNVTPSTGPVLSPAAPFDLSTMNDHWWRVSAKSTNEFSVDLRYYYGAFDGTSYTGNFAIVGTDTGQGGSAGEFYQSVWVPPSVIGATRGWGDSSATSELTGSIRRVYIDNYGEDVMMANSGGPIFYYDISANSSSGIPTQPIGSTYAAKALSTFSGSKDTPEIVDSFLISKKDGHCVALGCNDLGVTNATNAMLVRWSDQNNPFDWGPSATNTSGGQVLRSGSRIIGGVSTKDEVVIFTDGAVYSMRFIGPPDIFSFNLITDGVEIVSLRSAVNAANAVFFMGNDGFYVYTGAVEPLPCPVANYVFDDFNVSQKDKCFGAVNSAFSEVTWFYPSSDSFEPDRYVTFNYDERVWSYGQMDMSPLGELVGSTTSLNRTSWRDAIVFSSPMATYLKNYTPSTETAPLIEKSAVVSHESGTEAFGSLVASYIESGDISIADGENFSFISRYIPDVEIFGASGSTSGLLGFKMFTRNWPGESSSLSVSQDLTMTYASGSQGRDATFAEGVGSSSSIRARARSVSFRYENVSGVNWKYRLGDLRLDLRVDGRR